MIQCSDTKCIWSRAPGTLVPHHQSSCHCTNYLEKHQRHFDHQWITTLKNWHTSHVKTHIKVEKKIFWVSIIMNRESILRLRLWWIEGAVYWAHSLGIDGSTQWPPDHLFTDLFFHTIMIRLGWFKCIYKLFIIIIIGNGSLRRNVWWATVIANNRESL